MNKGGMPHLVSAFPLCFRDLRGFAWVWFSTAFGISHRLTPMNTDFHEMGHQRRNVEKPSHGNSSRIASTSAWRTVRGPARTSRPAARSMRSGPAFPAAPEINSSIRRSMAANSADVRRGKFFNDFARAHGKIYQQIPAANASGIGYRYPFQTQRQDADATNFRIYTPLFMNSLGVITRTPMRDLG